MRLAIVTNIMTPYRQPLYEAMGKRVEALEVFLMAESEADRSWHLSRPEVACRVLPGIHVRLRGHTWHWNFRVGRRLAEFEPDAVLSGGFAPANIAAMRYARRSGCPFVSFGAIADSSALGWARRRYVVSRSDGWIAFCSASRRRFEALGANSARMLCQPNPVPIETYHEAARRALENQKGSSVVAGLSRPILATASRIVTEKGYPELLDIFAQVIRSIPSASLLIVGDGRDLERYSRRAKARFGDTVRFAGFVAPEAMPGVLSQGDAFVFTTRSDTFGVVIAEAMACGLPVVASVRAGATEDLIEEGVTGFCIDATNIETSAKQVIRALSLSPEARRALVDAAHRSVRQWDTVPSAARMVDYLEYLVTRRRRRAA